MPTLTAITSEPHCRKSLYRLGVSADHSCGLSTSNDMSPLRPPSSETLRRSSGAFSVAVTAAPVLSRSQPRSPGGRQVTTPDGSSRRNPLTTACSKEDVDVSEDAAMSGLVLILQIRAVAPLEHNTATLLVLSHKLCHIELRRHVAALADQQIGH